MRRLVVLALAALVACTPGFSTRVGTITTPIANSLGRICWVEVDTEGAPPIARATYRADAVYDAGDLALTDRVEVQVFGRSEPPGSECTNRDDAADLPLSRPFELEDQASQRVEVGGDEFGAELAGLVNRGTFWLGAAADGNVALSEQTIRFEDGWIGVEF